ncbi:hypothetical protein BDV96DRAFT_507901 [Lophiotrema nucula]|uniref:Rhodopsin domain-containing protein n=1 Tax=Lophiotrema nucula TaxID=690887 RepID=A0A6A5YGL7_9PLEO|nr:hypothetical protein BDV96DRAFT_507901 [Lophiotrema nucula]
MYQLQPEHYELLRRTTEATNATYTGPWPGWLPIPITQQEYTIATTVLIVTLVLQIIAIVVFSARVYTRAYPVWKFTADDYIISLAFALETTMFGFGFAGNIWAWGGKRPATLTLDHIQYNAKYGSLTMPMWAWATGFVKISIGCMLLRFQQSSRWRWFMYFMVVACVLLMLFTVVTITFQCIPFSLVWDIKGETPLDQRRCFSIHLNHLFLFVTAACNVTLDLIFSLMPLTFLGKIRRPLREKVVIGGLMALGLVASAFSLSKAILAERLTKISDFTKIDVGAYLALIGLLSALEVQTALIAACIPTLRSSTKRLLVRIGLLHTTRNSGYRRYGVGSDLSGRPKAVRRRGRELHDLGSTESTSTEGTDEIREIEDDDRYTVDPITGRVTCTVPERAHTSRPRTSKSAFTHNDWQTNQIEPIQPRIVIKDGWELGRGVGVAQ